MRAFDVGVMSLTTMARQHYRGSVLITDGEQRAALAVVRSLGAAGWNCLVASTRGRSLAGSSRHATREYVLPDATAEPGPFAAHVTALVERERIDVVIPIAEPAVLALLNEREGIGARVPFPDLGAFAAICDKQGLLATAAQMGIRVPRQQELDGPAAAVSDEMQAPWVLKPHRSVCTAEDGTRVKLGVSWARTSQELHQALSSYPSAAFPILLQEAIVGPGVGIFVLMDAGAVVAAFSHRRIREKPPSGGVSVLRQSEPMNQGLLDRSVALLKRYNWSGVAMVEYKIDESTGEPVLMEVNGRFWGSLQLAVDAGVDFPRLLVEANSSNGALRTRPEYRFVRSRWFWGDVDHVAAVWLDRKSSAADRLRSIAGWLSAFLPGYREEVFRWSDPRPFMFETKAWIRQVVRA